MKTPTEKLNELILNDFELETDMYKIGIDFGEDGDYEKTLNSNQLQIINKTLKYYGYDPIFDVIDEPNQRLMYEYLNDYAQEIVNEFNLAHGNAEIEFRTDDHGDQNINQLLENNYEATGMYVILEAPNNSIMSAEIEFDEFDEEYESIAEYLEKTSDNLYDKIKDTLYSFDADYEFDELWAPNSNLSAREFLRILDEDQEFFEDVAKRM